MKVKFGTDVQLYILNNFAYHGQCEKINTFHIILEKVTFFIKFTTRGRYRKSEGHEIWYRGTPLYSEQICISWSIWKNQYFPWYTWRSAIFHKIHHQGAIPKIGRTWNLVHRFNLIFRTTLHIVLLAEKSKVKMLYCKMLTYLISDKTHKNGSNLHNLCVTKKPVLYVLHHSGFNTCTKFQNFPIPNKVVLLKKLSQI